MFNKVIYYHFSFSAAYITIFGYDESQVICSRMLGYYYSTLQSFSKAFLWKYGYCHFTFPA